MNLQQFAKLKPGDVIANSMSDSRGEIVTVDATGVRVRWIGGGRQGGDAPTWHYSVQSTAWFHWTLEETSDAETEPDTTAPAGTPQA